jgi:nitrogenase molybdenum-iron protein NifN
MPMGGSLAFKGIENTMLIMHGSQGCSTYIRRHISAHYNEPVDIASSSLNEKETVYGGAKNLKHGIKNVMKLYNPKVIGVLTTCLAETIGEDIQRIVEEFKLKHGIEDVDIITVGTPGYGVSQYEGYFSSLLAIIKYFVKEKVQANHINIISSLMSSADQREIKRILRLFDIPYVLIPDISETLDSSYKVNYSKIPSGGTKPADIKKMTGAIATIEIGQLIGENISPGVWLKNNFGVPLYRCPIPIGIENNDLFIKYLSEISGKPVPNELKIERGRLLDAMIDSHKYNGEGKAAIFGDPETVYSVTSLCVENGIVPKIIATGSHSNKLSKYLLDKISNSSIILDDTDFYTIQKYVREKNINILIGHSDGKFIMEKEGIPLVRIGFPIHDQVGGQRQLNIGYEGTMQFLDKLTNTLLDNKHKTYRNEVFSSYFAI